LGVLSPFHWFRKDHLVKKKPKLTKKAFEDKESYRWLLGYRFANKLAQKAPTTNSLALPIEKAIFMRYFKKLIKPYPHLRPIGL
jgi:hypothetical protein